MKKGMVEVPFGIARGKKRSWTHAGDGWTTGQEAQAAPLQQRGHAEEAAMEPPHLPPPAACMQTPYQEFTSAASSVCNQYMAVIANTVAIAAFSFSALKI